MQEKSDEFYDKLKAQLEKSTEWPSTYLFKFILPTQHKAELNQLSLLFDNTGAIINTKQSSKGKYTSVSIHVKMKSPDQVILKYKEVGNKVKGVISL